MSCINFEKGLWLIRLAYLDEEPVVLLPEILDAGGQKHSLAAALTVQYQSLLEQAIKLVLLLGSYAKESIAQDLLNVIMVMFDL